MHIVLNLFSVLVISFTPLYAADTPEIFRVCGVPEQEIGHTEKIFTLSYYPKKEPLIVFGHKKIKPTEQPTIETALSCRFFVAGMLVLHAKSSDYKNLMLIHNHFLDDLTDTQLLKGRVGKEKELSPLIFEYVQHVVQTYNAQQNDDALVTDSVTEEEGEISQITKKFRNKNFIRCNLRWLSSFGNELRSKLYKFKLPIKKSLSPRVDFKKLQTSIMDVSTYGLSKECKSKLKQPKFQEKILTNLSKYSLTTAAIEYALDMKSGLKPSYTNPSFFMLANYADIFDYGENEDYNHLLNLEEELMAPDLDSLYLMEDDTDIQESFQNIAQQNSSYIKYYHDIDAQGDKKLSVKDIIGMLSEAVKK